MSSQQTLFTDTSFPGTVIYNPSWLPEELCQDLLAHGQLEYSFKFTKAERKAYKHEKPIKPSAWSEKNRVVTMSSLPGKWKNEITPYLVGIMDAIDFSSVREAVVCKGPQSGVSEAVHNYIGYCVDRKSGPVLYVYPDQTTAKENAQDRIIPMLESSPRLSSYLTGAQDDKASMRINLQHMQIYMAWASSTSRLANKPIRYGIADEIDKEGFKAKSKETSSLNLLRKRLITYQKNNLSKLVMISTPTVETGNIWVEMNNCEVIFDYWAICPKCAKAQTMVFSQILWEGGSKADPEAIIKERSARYKCIDCKAQWNDMERDVAVRMGQWRSRGKDLELFKYLESFKPRKIGFHLPSWYTYFVSLSDAVASFIKGKKSVEDRKDFFNAHMAMPFIPKRQTKNESRILLLKDDRPSGVVPGGGVVAGLVAGVDTHKFGFWYEIRAFGWGLTSESWQIRAGYLETWDALERVLWGSSYEDVDGNNYIIELAIQDSLGHRTKEVYDFCKAHTGAILPLKGEARMAQPHSYSNIEFYPGTKKPIPGGLRLLRANVNYYKNEMSRLLDISPGDPGAYHMNADLTPGWAKQYTMEYVNDEGLWECPDNVDNHLWDCSNYALIASDVLGIRHWEKPDEIGEYAEPTPVSRNNPRKQKRGGSRW